MSQEVQSMNEDDRRIFEANLARFGLIGDQHADGGLVVPHGATVVVNRDTRDRGNHFVFRTESIDQFKAWVGTPDAAFKKKSDCKLPLPSCPVPAETPTEKLSSDHQQALYDGARAYIWGPSHRLTEHKAGLEAHLDLETVTHVYTTLDVKSALTFDDPSAVVVANTINYYPNGQIVGEGNLTVYATNIFHKN